MAGLLLFGTAAVVAQPPTVNKTLHPRLAALEERVYALEREMHQHKHEHAGVFEWQGEYELQAGTHTWLFEKLGGMYGANDTSMRIVLSLGDADDDDTDELEAAVDLCLPSEMREWREGDAPMSADVCFKAFFNRDKETTTLSFAVRKAGAYLLFTQHVPTEFGESKNEIGRAHV